MPEVINDRQVFSLYEVTSSIKKTLAERYRSSYWIKAEMNKLNFYLHSGHCYPDLVEKKEGRVIAQLRSNLWSDDFQRINRNFQKVLNEELKDGINILFCARITFDTMHGLNLRIIDIDPSYTLGELEREKAETIQKLREEEIFDRNKQHELPLLPQRLAIISVQTSKGYADFMSVIGHNAWGYKFFHMLFPALLQGDNAAESIIGQLKQIEKVKEHFDLVAIIRGGGGDIGLTCYNNYALAREVALFPLPIMTGIGHATNETVVEMVSFENAITPTKLAENLLQRFHAFWGPVQRAEKILAEKPRILLQNANQDFNNLISRFRTSSRSIFTLNQEKSRGLSDNLKRNIQLMMLKNGQELKFLDARVRDMDPLNVLKRGYTITKLKGQTVKEAAGLKKDDELETLFYDGVVMSRVETIKKTKKK